MRRTACLSVPVRVTGLLCLLVAGCAAGERAVITDRGGVLSSSPAFYYSALEEGGIAVVAVFTGGAPEGIRTNAAYELSQALTHAFPKVRVIANHSVLDMVRTAGLLPVFQQAMLSSGDGHGMDAGMLRRMGKMTAARYLLIAQVVRYQKKDVEDPLPQPVEFIENNVQPFLTRPKDFHVNKDIEIAAMVWDARTEGVVWEGHGGVTIVEDQKKDRLRMEELFLQAVHNLSREFITRLRVDDTEEALERRITELEAQLAEERARAPLQVKELEAHRDRLQLEHGHAKAAAETAAAELKKKIADLEKEGERETTAASTRGKGWAEETEGIRRELQELPVKARTREEDLTQKIAELETQLSTERAQAPLREKELGEDIEKAHKELRELPDTARAREEEIAQRITALRGREDVDLKTHQAGREALRAETAREEASLTQRLSDLKAQVDAETPARGKELEDTISRLKKELAELTATAEKRKEEGKKKIQELQNQLAAETAPGRREELRFAMGRLGVDLVKESHSTSKKEAGLKKQIEGLEAEQKQVSKGATPKKQQGRLAEIKKLQESLEGVRAKAVRQEEELTKKTGEAATRQAEEIKKLQESLEGVRAVATRQEKELTQRMADLETERTIAKGGVTRKAQTLQAAREAALSERSGLTTWMAEQEAGLTQRITLIETERERTSRTGAAGEKERAAEIARLQKELEGAQAEIAKREARAAAELTGLASELERFQRSGSQKAKDLEEEMKKLRIQLREKTKPFQQRIRQVER